MTYFTRILRKVQTSLALPLLIFATLTMVSGCGVKEFGEQVGREDKFERAVKAKREGKGGEGGSVLSSYYSSFYKTVTERRSHNTGTSEIAALDSLPKDPEGMVNWTAAVVEGVINPRGSLDPRAPEEPMLDMNIFIEAKVPLMNNVLFPHSIHTYWLSCKNCHPKIFVPMAGMNEITMNEIFAGEWCGRCHNKVAFPFWPRVNCLRCHSVAKSQSLEQETFK